MVVESFLSYVFVYLFGMSWSFWCVNEAWGLVTTYASPRVFVVVLGPASGASPSASPAPLF